MKKLVQVIENNGTELSIGTIYEVTLETRAGWYVIEHEGKDHQYMPERFALVGLVSKASKTVQ